MRLVFLLHPIREIRWGVVVYLLLRIEQEGGTHRHLCGLCRRQGVMQYLDQSI